MKTKSICGLDCRKCDYRDSCKGCTATDGKPFGGACIVAECCKSKKNGTCGDFSKNICRLKRQLIDEFNSLGIEDMDEVADLYALVGSYINLEYTLPNGQSLKLWDDTCVYLGNQICKKNSDRCYGLTADEKYLLVCEYGENGSDAEIVVYKRRG